MTHTNCNADMSSLNSVLTLKCYFVKLVSVPEIIMKFVKRNCALFTPEEFEKLWSISITTRVCLALQDSEVVLSFGERLIYFRVASAIRS
jgi:hypothetical protein